MKQVRNSDSKQGRYSKRSWSVGMGNWYFLNNNFAGEYFNDRARSRSGYSDSKSHTSCPSRKKYEDLSSCVDEMEWDDAEGIRECIQGSAWVFQ